MQNLGKMFSLMRINFLKTIILGIFLLQPVMAWSQETQAADKAVEPSWTAPDIVALPVDWWSKFFSENKEVFRIRAELLTTKVNEYVGSLDAENLVAAQASVKTLRSNLDTVLSLQGTPAAPQNTALPTLDSYTLKQLLDLRERWREGRSKLDVLELEKQQLSKQKQLLAQRRDLALTQFADTDPSSPARLLAGLHRINLRLEQYFLEKQLADKTAQQAQLGSYLDDVSQKITYAASHLLTDDLSLKDLDSAIHRLSDTMTGATGKLAAIQQKLLDAINADKPNKYKILDLKQQLTKVSVEEMLARLKLELEYAKRDWFLLRTGTITSTLDLHKSDPTLRTLLDEATQQSALWTEASRNTLITPAPDKGRTAKRTYNQAQTNAHKTLSEVADITATMDNLSLVQAQVASESLKLEQGFGGVWLRIRLFTDELWAKSKALLNISLFHFGDSPVTAGGLTKALLIFLFFWALSWIIRHLLDRLVRRQQFQQGSFYASGRVLHYIILTIAVIAALGSLGLDFSSFALIAGALSVGIGFGLQTVVLNFVSGLILLFEGSIRVGDYVELDSGLMGVVREIRSRATLITTNDNIDVIVPNSELTANRMINWTLRESIARMRIPFAVAYGSDKELVKQAALDAVDEGEFCIRHTIGRKPAVRLISFGENALNFELRVWVNRQGVRRPIFVRSSILWALDNKFRENGLRVPFPQREVHVRKESGVLSPQRPELEPSDDQ